MNLNYPIIVHGVVTLKTSPPNSITQCRFVIKAPSGYHVQLEITNIGSGYSNCNYNSLRLFEGGNPDFVNDIPTATYCSINSDRPTYLSQASALTVLLTRRSGYNFMYPTIHFRLVPGYNMVFNLSEGFIPSPNFLNSLLPRSQSFIYRLEGAPGMKVQLFFSYMNLGSNQTCNGARLSIYECPTATGVPAHTKCGRKTTSPYYYSSYGDSLNIYERIGATGEEIVTNLLNDAKMTYWSIGKNITLVFQSDNSNVITGLKMHYTATNDLHYSWSNWKLGTLQSWNYPYNNPYTSDIENEAHFYFIWKQNHSCIHTLEKSTGCSKDSLNIYEGSVSTESLKSTRCGRDGDPYVSKTSSIILLFTSDERISKTGYSVNIEACSTLFRNDTGTLFSPQYPYTYPTHAKCTYFIRLAKGAKIQLVFRNFSLFSGHGDQLTIHDVHASFSIVYVVSNAKDVLASGNEVVLTFSSWWRSTTANSFKGFRIYYYDRQGFCSKYKPCRNNASCTNIGDSNYTCSCSDDFSGRNCSVKIVPCKSNPCMNNGTCTDLYGHGKPMFNCSCTDDFQGNRCQNQIGEQFELYDS
eukprot:gene8754-14780_t